MATKRKKKQQAESEAPKRAKPRKRAKKRKAAKRRTGAARSSGGKRARRPLQLVLHVQDTPANSAALAPLNDAQRVDLAAMDPRKTLSKRPAWVVDDALWRKAVRVVSPHWKRLRHPWCVVAWAYLRMDGPVGHARGLEGPSEREEQPRGKRRAAARARSSTRSQYGDEDLDDAEPMRVERLRVDGTGIDEQGNYRGQGIWWRVWNASIDSVVRAATATAARAIVTGRAH